MECTVLYKRYRSLALNIGLFEKENRQNVLWNIYSQSSKFRFCNKKKKKVLQRQEIGLLFVLVKA